MIHPEKHTRHKEFRDYWIRDKVCRELEREYGLVVDNGRNKGAERSLGEKAALLEAHTGQQSFEGYAQAQRAAILQMLEAATSWQETHEALACHGLEIKPRRETWSMYESSRVIRRSRSSVPRNGASSLPSTGKGLRSAKPAWNRSNSKKMPPLTSSGPNGPPSAASSSV